MLVPPNILSVKIINQFECPQHTCAGSAGGGAGEDGDEQQVRQICPHVHRTHQRHCRQDLPYVMGGGAKDAYAIDGKEGGLFAERHHTQRNESAGEGKEDSRQTAKQRSQEAPHHHDGDGLLPTQGVQRHQCGDIGKTQLYAGKGYYQLQRDKPLRVGQRQGQRHKHGALSKGLRSFHICHPTTKSTSELSETTRISTRLGRHTRLRPVVWMLPLWTQSCPGQFDAVKAMAPWVTAISLE